MIKIKEKTKLQKTYSKGERARRLLLNLEKLREEGSIADEQYESLKDNYSQILEEATSEINEIKKGISRDIEDKERTLKIYEQELKNLEARFKVGEMPADRYQKLEKRTKTKIEKVKVEISELKGFLNSNSSTEVGGYIEVPIKRGEGLSILGVSLPDFSDFSTLDFKELISPSTIETEFTKGKLMAIAGAALMVISVVFLPWAWLLVSVSIFQVNSVVGIFCLILAFLAIALCFLPNLRIRALGHIGIGGIGAIIGILFIVKVATEEIMGMRVGMEVIGSGVYVYIIGSVIALIGGLMELKEG